LTLPVPAFIEDVVVRIGIAHPAEHYHVPLLISPWSYSVYRGG
jgi:5-hydroxyisourate hydrolase